MRELTIKPFIFMKFKIYIAKFAMEFPYVTKCKELLRQNQHVNIIKELSQKLQLRFHVSISLVLSLKAFKYMEPYLNIEKVKSEISDDKNKN